MINIIIDTDRLKELQDNGYKYVMLPYKRYETVIAKEGTLTSEIIKIITEVENCRIDSNGNVESKFTNTPISLDSISEGAKTTIYVYYRTKVVNNHEIINITSCGPNAIRYILENYNDSSLVLFLGHLEIPRDVENAFMINGEIVNGVKDFFEVKE